MSYVNYAYMEFKAAGWLNSDGAFADEMQGAVCSSVMRLLQVFSEEGFSGSSAPYAVDLFSKLALFKPIAPLTGEDWEWMQVGTDGDNGGALYQNLRVSHVFKNDTSAWDIDGRIFWEWGVDSDGQPFKLYYTNFESRTPVKFPYIPKSEYVYKQSESEPKTPPQNEQGLL